jgi:hypothetical protein
MSNNTETKEDTMRREIDSIIHPLLSDPMDMNAMYAATDKVIKVFKKYSTT